MLSKKEYEEIEQIVIKVLNYDTHLSRVESNYQKVGADCVLKILKDRYVQDETKQNQEEQENYWYVCADIGLMSGSIESRITYNGIAKTNKDLAFSQVLKEIRSYIRDDCKNEQTDNFVDIKFIMCINDYM